MRKHHIKAETPYKPDRELHVSIVAYSARDQTITIRVNDVMMVYEVQGRVEDIVHRAKAFISFKEYRRALEHIKQFKKPHTLPKTFKAEGDKAALHRPVMPKQNS